MCLHGLLQWVTFGDIDSFALRVKEAGIPLVVMVQSVQQAQHAVAKLGADAIVAQVHGGCRVAVPSFRGAWSCHCRG